MSRRRSETGGFPQQDWFLAVALAVFVAVVVWFGRSIKDFVFPNVYTLTLPSLVGQRENDAITEADRLRLRAVVVDRQPSDQYPDGVVTRQDPAPGSEVREGRQVSLVVSTGIQLITMPDLRYESMREVNLDLSQARLQLGKVRTIANDDVPAGRVVNQEPLPLTSIRSGTLVNLDLSKGPPQLVSVPSLTGMQIDEARALATSSKIQLGQVVWTPFGRNGPPRGTVVRQLPLEGAKIDPFQRVSLQVSAGPGAAGYIVREVHATVTAPAGDQPKHLRLVLTDETGTRNMYDGYAQPRQRLDFEVTAVGTSQLDTYVDGELVNSAKLGVEPALPYLQER